MGVSITSRQAVFLDRDGILNKSIIKQGKPYPPENLEEVVIHDEVKQGIRLLKNEGLLLIMITNQPDIARNKTTEKNVNSINNFVKHILNLDDIFMCVHDDNDNCNCRKPKPGMIIDAQKKWNIELNGSFLVGERWKDISAGKKMNLITFFLDLGYKEKKVDADFEYKTFTQIVNQIIKLKNEKYIKS
jgi:D-glycero-D-manno-heptose 1,7-bisphosphate phosphatase